MLEPILQNIHILLQTFEEVSLKLPRPLRGNEKFLNTSFFSTNFGDGHAKEEEGREEGGEKGGKEVETSSFDAESVWPSLVHV
jgi:hypothetical protein